MSLAHPSWKAPAWIAFRRSQYSRTKLRPLSGKRWELCERCRCYLRERKLQQAALENHRRRPSGGWSNCNVVNNGYCYLRPELDWIVCAKGKTKNDTESCPQWERYFRFTSACRAIPSVFYGFFPRRIHEINPVHCTRETFYLLMDKSYQWILNFSSTPHRYKLMIALSPF